MNCKKCKTKESVLSDFFTYEYQAELIHDAQMLDHSYENALIEYWKIFTANLIKCYEAGRLKGIESRIYEYSAKILDSINSDEFLKTVILEEGDGVTKTSSKRVSIITEMFLLIRQVYHCWTSCDLGTSIKIMDHILNDILQISEISTFTLSPTSILFRGRVSDAQLDKSNMFHIPFMQAYKIRNQRYSITGQPILYLTDRVSGVFNELSIRNREEYEKLHIAQYRLNPDKATWFDNIFDITINDNDLERAARVDNFKAFNSCFCKFILSCVCSFPNVRGHDKSFFVEEYVIPQLVTQLVRNNFKGIRYNTINNYCNDERCYQRNNYVNYAFFTQKNDANNSIDINLRDRFIIDSPITVLEVDDYSSLRNYSFSDVIDMIEEHFDRINGLMSVMSQIKGSSYNKDYNEEKDYYFKDGKYRYIKIES